MAEGEAGFRWLNEYEKTWEEIQEDDDGALQATIDDIIHKAKRKKLLVRKSNVRLGMMRHLFIVVDMSSAMKKSDLLHPSSLACVTKLLEDFINEYFDQNPISQLGLIITRDKRAEKVTELSGNPKVHVNALKDAASKGPLGEPSLQNSLQAASKSLKHLPKHASREILIVYGSLTSCDPGDIFETIEDLKKQNITCSIIGLSAEVKLCKTLCSETTGVYNVILDAKHLHDLIVENLRPPVASVSTEASLVRMGFPKHLSNNYPSLCLCHIDETKSVEGLGSSGYFCPQCHSKYCDLPVECKVCSLALVSAPHLARSYQHLFPLSAFEEFNRHNDAHQRLTSVCHGCQKLCQDLVVYRCQRCSEVFCNDCDLFIHETLHTCPGCSSRRLSEDS